MSDKFWSRGCRAPFDLSRSQGTIVQRRMRSPPDRVPVAVMGDGPTIVSGMTVPISTLRQAGAVEDSIASHA